MSRKQNKPGPRQKGLRRVFMPFALLAAAVAGGFLMGAWSSDSPGGEKAVPAVHPQGAVAPAAAIPAAPSITRIRMETDGFPSLGPADAPVTVVEFVDYQCPFCKRAHHTVKEVAEKYGDKIRLVFLQNPLAFHKNAPLAAQAALAAGEQGRFSEMQDLLLDSTKLQMPDIVGFAQKLGLDLKAFQESLDSGRHALQVQEGRSLASKVGATATPYFFINGRPLRGAQPVSAFERIIDEELSGNLPATRWLAKVQAPVRKARPQEDPNKVYKIDIAQSVSKGPQDAPITLVEFTDFQCPFCGRSQATLTKILDAYPGKVRLVVKNVPLSFHKNARPAAVAALAADRQGKYWEYRKLLFANQRSLTSENLQAYARQVGMDMNRFNTDLKDPELEGVLKRDQLQASAVGVSGTPTFFVNGKKMVGAQPFERFKAAIDKHLGATTGAGASL